MRRRLVILGLCLLGGACMSVASAMLSSCLGEWSTILGDPVIPPPPVPSYLSEMPLRLISVTDSDGLYAGFSQRKWLCEIDPEWVRREGATPRNAEFALARLYYGWPFRSMSCDSIAVYLKGSNTYLPHEVTILDRAQSLAGYRSMDSQIFLPDEFPRWVPPQRSPPVFRPMPRVIEWPGFLASTTLYGSLMWLVVFAPFTARRIRRRCRGRCVKCGYQLEDLPTCPECGTPSNAKATEAAC